MNKLLKKVKSNNKGFTLVELIVVIAIIGILAGIMMPKLNGYTDKARKKVVLSDAKNVYTIFESYYAEKGEYPTKDEDIKTTYTKPSDVTINYQETDKLFSISKQVGAKTWKVICETDGKLGEPTEEGSGDED